MNLDQHLISIRRRNFAGICDLAWLVLRNYWMEIFLWISIMAVPLSVLNFYLLDWTLDTRLIDESNPVFGAMTLWLVFLESQVSTVFLTAWIGRLMFHQARDWRGIIRDVASRWPALVWVHGFLRPSAIFLFLFLLVESGQTGVNEAVVIYLVIVGMIIVSIRWFRPFANEILILERTPVFAGKKGRISWSRRSRGLHGTDSSMVMSSVIGGGILNLLLVMAIYAFFLFLEQVLVLGIGGEWWARQFFWTVSLWVVVAYSAIVRFLAYIDLRSRQEGWDLELKIRAEEKRLALSE